MFCSLSLLRQGSSPRFAPFLKDTYSSSLELFLDELSLLSLILLGLEVDPSKQALPAWALHFSCSLYVVFSDDLKYPADRANGVSSHKPIQAPTFGLLPPSLRDLRRPEDSRISISFLILFVVDCELRTIHSCLVPGGCFPQTSRHLRFLKVRRSSALSYDGPASFALCRISLSL